MFSKMWTKKSTNGSLPSIDALRDRLREADAVVIGAGSGLSTSAGYTYTGERFARYFTDFQEKYGFSDMYSGGFYPYQTPEESWAFWSRYVWINRFIAPPKPVYEQMLSLVDGKDYFFITTNVDHCFQRAGFDKKRLFYTQGDYGLFQCSTPCCQETFDNEAQIRRMVEAQGYVIEADGRLTLPEGQTPQMTIPSQPVPRCPHCGQPMTMNLRCDSTFVQDEGWHRAAEHYAEFLRRHEGLRIVFLELGVGYNTPGIIKYDFWQRTVRNPKASYICINQGQALCPEEIRPQALCIDGDIGEIFSRLTYSSSMLF